MATLTVRISQISPKGGYLTLNLIDVDTLSGGVGGWDLIDRKKKQQGTHWTGTPALVYTLPLRLDGFATGASGADVSVEADCRTLTNWGRSRTSKGTIEHPPILGLTGNVQTAASTKWVITNLTWGDLVRNDNGTRIQQDVTVELTQYIPVTAAELKAADGSTSSSSKSSAKKVKAKTVAKKAAAKTKQPSVDDILNHKGATGG